MLLGLCWDSIRKLGLPRTSQEPKSVSSVSFCQIYSILGFCKLALLLDGGGWGVGRFSTTRVLGPKLPGSPTLVN